MGVARRLYLYAVSSFSLLVLAIGLYNLVALVFGEVADALGSTFLGGGADVGREQVSLAIALVVVGAPLFAIHWMLVGRGWRGTGASGLEDRHSAIRAFHMALVATVALIFATGAAVQVIERAFGTVFGVDAGFGSRISDSLATVVVAIPIWWYHQRRRNLDIRLDRMTGAEAWITRFHRYAWTFAGLLVLTVGASQVLQAIASELVGRPVFGDDGRLWLRQLAGSLAWIVAGAALFWFHAADARRAIRDSAVIGEDDRASALRAAYFGGVILVTLGFVAVSDRDGDRRTRAVRHRHRRRPRRGRDRVGRPPGTRRRSTAGRDPVRRSRAGSIGTRSGARRRIDRRQRSRARNAWACTWRPWPGSPS